jgi:AcrR family transcriptional regulator
MNGFERRREQKKEAIRRAALDLYRIHGVKKVSVSDIAGRAGVSPVTIYNYFGSKQALLTDVVKWFMLTVLDEYAAIMHGGQPYLERWQRVLFEKSQLRQTFHSEFLAAVIAETAEIRDFVDTEMQPRISQMFMDFMEEGKREGYLRPDLSLETVMLYIDMIRIFAYAQPERYARMLDDENLFVQFASLFLYGLIGKETHTELLHSLAGRPETPARTPPVG